MHNTNSKIKFETSMLKSRLCDFKRNTSIAPVPPPAAVNPNNNNKKVIFKNCAPFTDCISEINNTQIANAEDIDVLMSI